MGNLHSVQTCFERMNQPLIAVQHPQDLKNCDALVLPGVGSFDPAMQKLHASGLVAPLQQWHAEARPLLGICLGLQLLFERSDEGDEIGLGLLRGTVTKLPSGQGERIPHMGWGKLKRQNPCPLLPDDADEPWVYFVHSFAAAPALETDLAATVPFGHGNATAMVWQGRTGACQFHPEKSSVAGSQLLQRWLSWLQHGANDPK